MTSLRGRWIPLAADVVYGRAFPFHPEREAATALVDPGSLTLPSLPSEYLRSAGTVAERRVALAGVRLADLLERRLVDGPPGAA